MKNISSKSSIEVIAPASLVWEALTTPDLIKKYFLDSTAISDWKVGGPIIFEGQWQGNRYRDKGTILEMNPYKTFRYNYWSPLSGVDDRPENYFPITYSLSETKGVTRVTITQENISHDSMKAQTEQNWKKVLQNLKDLVENELVTSSPH